MFPQIQWYGSYFTYLMFSLPALLLGLWAQAKVKSAFNKYSKVHNYTGLTGAQVARRLLDSNGLHDVRIEQVSGTLSDHYDPGSKTLRLSPEIYSTPSIAAAGVAAHEAGHAIQDNEHYFPLVLRTALVPTVQLGSWLGPIIFMIGLILSTPIGEKIAIFGLILFALTAVFAIITLPVELNATSRAKAALQTSGFIGFEQMTGINSVLDAAALTYVAAAAQAVSSILYYMFMLMRRNDR
ncbi:zinc metallopeptidase [Leptolinea tardivitalis]|uniref:Zinc metallopeptidase n=1 Tax=Leptolinea tardivitalis TaxID=229920 RepID=A0A0P6WYN3_9CHLR|nr:zinc metallopeptidase [Leptolinea tardivitalis]KPL71733.1 zinc metallopeptidase [Leptolinea tardivitalis]GAP20092.1 predicted Zn-dependent protease [Leptolinea tardivitalis]